MLENLENPMVSGYGYPPEIEPVYTCPRCGTGCFKGETTYLWDGDWICDECLVDAVNSCSMYDLSEMAGEEECHVAQMMENALTADDYSRIFYIETEEAT